MLQKFVDKVNIEFEKLNAPPINISNIVKVEFVGYYNHSIYGPCIEYNIYFNIPDYRKDTFFLSDKGKTILG